MNEQKLCGDRQTSNTIYWCRFFGFGKPGVAKLKETSDLLEGCKSSQNRRIENQAQKRKAHRETVE